MIHVERGKAPAILSSPEFHDYRSELEGFFNVTAAERTRKRFDFPQITDHEELMAALARAFSSKCAYCETPLDDVTLELESFRPRLRAIGRDGKVSAEHYWWLAYEWENLLAACMVCNRLKGSRFPIRGRRAKVGTVGEELRRERPLLLDPCLDEPEAHLLFAEDGKVASATEEGRTTIEVLGLNRETLVKARLDVLEELKEAWQKQLIGGGLTPPALAALHAPALPHLAPRRQFLEQWSRELAAERPDLQPLLEPFLQLRTTLPGAARPLKATFEDYRQHLVAQESYSAEGRGGKEGYYAKTRLIERVVIRNFKALRELELTFPPAGDKGPCFVLLGENGTGKSSILKAVALALMGREHHRRLRGLDASSYVTFGEDEGHVHVYLTGVPEPVELTFRRGEREFGLKPGDPKVLLLGYGATRLLPRPGTTPVKKFGASKADNLFSPFVPLADANAWLARLGEEKREPMNEGLKQLLLLGKEARVTLDAGPPPVASVELHGQRIPLSELSDGYQGMAALAADVMGVMGKRWPEMALAEGIVLIDEIDAHLHPRWKMQVVERLRAVFPRLQFV